MHADEKNEGLSLQYGRDIYHYHLHVVALPVVEKEIKWSTRCKDKTLIGTVKKVIHQISDSKKWKSPQAVDESGKPIFNKNGNPILIPSFSLLQDRFFEHMKAAGFKDFERGIKGSTAEHLSVTEYKVKQDLLTLEMLNDHIQGKQLEEDWLHQSLEELRLLKAEIDDIDSVGKKTLTGKVQMTTENFDKLKSLAKEGVLSRSVIQEQKDEISRLHTAFNRLRERYDKVMEEIKPYREVLRLAPKKVKEFFKELFEKPESETLPWKVTVSSPDTTKRPTKRRNYER